MTTPLYDSLLGEVLHGAHVAKGRLATARAGIDRLHAPDAYERCPLCRESWPCTTRQLVDGLSRGALDESTCSQLVDEALRAEELSLEDSRAPMPTSIPAVAELLDRGRTSKALDILFGSGRE